MSRVSLFIHSVYCHPGQTHRVLEDSRAIQRTVFIEEQGIDPSNVFNDEYQAMHYVLYLHTDVKRTAVSCARTMRPQPQDGIKIGRVATLKRYRGNQYATRLLEYLIAEQGRIFNPPFFYLHSRLDTQGLYESLQFKPVYDVFNEVGIYHIRMELDWSRNTTP